MNTLSSGTSEHAVTSVTPKQKTRVYRSSAQWKKLIDELSTTSMTKANFCKKHKIAPSNLYKWQKHFEAAQNDTGAFIDISDSVVKKSGCGPMPEDNHSWQVELELGHGVVLRVRAE